MPVPKPSPHPRLQSQPTWTVLEDAHPRSSSSRTSSSPIPGLSSSAALAHRPRGFARKQCGRNNKSTPSAANIKNRAHNDKSSTSNVRPKPSSKTPPKPSNSVASPPVLSHSRKRRAPISSDSESDHPPPRLPTLNELMAQKKKKEKERQMGEKAPRNDRPAKIRKTVSLGTINIGDSDTNDGHQTHITPKTVPTTSVVEDVIDLCSDDDELNTSPITSPIKSQAKSSSLHMREEDGVIILSTDDEDDHTPPRQTQRTGKGVCESPKDSLFSSPTKSTTSDSLFSSPAKSIRSSVNETFTSPQKSSLTLVTSKTSGSISMSRALPLKPDFGDLLNFDDDPQPQDFSPTPVSPPQTSFTRSQWQSKPTPAEERRRTEKRPMRDSKSPAGSPRKRFKTPLFLPNDTPPAASPSPPPSTATVFKPNGLLGSSAFTVAVEKKSLSMVTYTSKLSKPSTSKKPSSLTIFGPKLTRTAPPEDTQMIDLDSGLEDPPWPKHNSVFDSGPAINLELDIKYSDHLVPPPLLSTLWFSRVKGNGKGKGKKKYVESPYFKKQNNAGNEEVGNLKDSSPPQYEQVAAAVPSTLALKAKSSSKAAHQPEDQFTVNSLAVLDEDLEKARCEGQKLMDLVRKRMKARDVTSDAPEGGNKSTAEPLLRSDSGGSHTLSSKTLGTPPLETEVNFILTTERTLGISELGGSSLRDNEESDAESLDDDLEFAYPEEITA